MSPANPAVFWGILVTSSIAFVIGAFCERKLTQVF